MLRCTAPTDEACPAMGTDVSCLPWCDYLEEDEDGNELG